MVKTHFSHQKREALRSKVTDMFLLVSQKFTVQTDLKKKKNISCKNTVELSFLDFGHLFLFLPVNIVYILYHHPPQVFVEVRQTGEGPFQHLSVLCV